jgi:uncharacterized protein (TIGR03546 family)
MSFLLNQIFQFLKLLNSDKGSGQIAAGVACGVILGLTPALSLQSVLVWIILFFFRIQIGAALITAVFVAFPAYLLDPVFDSIGGAILEMDSLRATFTRMSELPIVPLTRFNNSVVMGAGAVAIALTPVVYIAARIFVAQYRAKVVARFQETKFWKGVKATGFYKWYVRYEELKG